MSTIWSRLVNLAGNITGVLTVPNGGTGAATLTSHGVLVGAGTSAVSGITAGTAGQLLIGATGADPAFGSTVSAATTFSGSTSFTGGLNLDYSGAVNLSQNVNVAGKSLVAFGASTGNIDGLTGGVAGQTVLFYGSGSTSSVTLRHNNGSGTQKFFLPVGQDLTVSAGYGGTAFFCDGTNWFLVANSVASEYVTASLVRSSATSLVASTPKTVANITLTPGDWNLSGMLGYKFAATTTVTFAAAAISATTNALPAADTSCVPTSGECRVEIDMASSAPNTDICLTIPTYRTSLTAASSTFYLVADSAFATSTATAYGSISARRVR